MLFGTGPSQDDPEVEQSCSKAKFLRASLACWRHGNPPPRLCNCSVPRGRRAHIRLSQCHSTPSFCCKVRPLPLPATGSEAPLPWLQRFPARSYFDLLLACRLCRLCLFADCHNAFVNLCSGLGLEIQRTVNENYLCMCFFFFWNYLAKTCEASCGETSEHLKTSPRI